MDTVSRASAARRRAPPAAAGAETAEGRPGRVLGVAGVAAYLRQAIVDGAYVFGERLPAERRLAASLSSSRATVREALRMLEHDNLITRRVGSGTFVAYRPGAAGDDVAEMTSPLELIEVRLAVEPPMTRLATVNATARDIERMADVLVRLEASGADANHFSKWDQQFHQALAEATRNPLMASVYQRINHVRGHAQWNAMKDKILTRARIEAYNRHHRAIFDAVASRDAEAAVRTIAEHLEAARRDLLAF